MIEHNSPLKIAKIIWTPGVEGSSNQTCQLEIHSIHWGFNRKITEQNSVFSSTPCLMTQEGHGIDDTVHDTWFL